MTTRQPFIDRDFYSDPRRRARSAVTRALSRPLRVAGFDLELRGFYSPVPDLSALPDHVWQHASAMPGVDLDPKRGFELIEGELAPYIAEFRPPRQSTGDRLEFFLDNGLFQGGDADLLYAIIRAQRPARVLELGAGFSTLVAAEAVRANRAEGHETRLVSCDPHAARDTRIDGLAEILPVAAENLDPSLYGDLAENDILFIDSSHTVRIGGDVVHLLTEVIPSLAPGVLVHLHDVFLPYAYPREWFEHNRWYWAEQYLLQALLAGNRGLEVIAPAHAMWRADPERMQRAVPNIAPAHPPISFWIRVRAPVNTS
jgi:hypothetical protein